MNPEQIKQRIDTFIEEHSRSQVYLLMHAELEDYNLSYFSLSRVLTDLPNRIHEWLAERSTDSEDAYTRFADNAWLWSEVWALIGLVNELLEMPNDVLERVADL